jgi:RNA polymerase sigma-70 factor (ECF subfamily)
MLTKPLPGPSASAERTDASGALTASVVYRDNADFVWRSLQHLGIPTADLEDVAQEVFVVVHKKLHTYDESSRLSTWLFGICLRIASRHRRRAYFRWEQRTPEPPERVDASTPEDRASAREQQVLLTRALERLSLAHRAVFVLFEIEGNSCAEIAELLDVPIGTVHSRLHHARKEVLERLSRRSIEGAE